MKNPHDKFFKETFGDIEVTQDFLENYLPAEVRKSVDLNSLVPQKDSFIDPRLEESFSDLLFQVNIKGNEGYVYFLFEHKSSPERGIALQLLRYIVNIWEAKTKNENEWALPVIIPLVIYQGRDRWSVPRSLNDMIRGYTKLPEELKGYVPDFNYQLYDLSYRSDEEIKGRAILKIYQTLIKEITNKNKEAVLKSIEKALTYLVEIENKEKGIDYFETMLRYIFGASESLTEAEVQKIVSQVEYNYPEGSDVIMTLAEQYIEKGIEQGINIGLSQSVIMLLEANFGNIPDSLSTAITALNADALGRILRRASSYENIQEVKNDIELLN